VNYGRSDWSACCVDVNECADVTSTCGVGAESCSNDAGGYTCTCLDGYEFKHGTCTGGPIAPALVAETVL